MNADFVAPETVPPLFHFRATQLGGYFHGHCSSIRNEEHRLILQGRFMARFIFEPHATKPAVEIIQLGQLTLLKKDFHVVATRSIAPVWLEHDPR